MHKSDDTIGDGHDELPRNQSLSQLVEKVTFLLGSAHVSMDGFRLRPAKLFKSAYLMSSFKPVSLSQHPMTTPNSARIRAVLFDVRSNPPIPYLLTLT